MRAIDAIRKHKTLYEADHGWDKTTLDALDTAIKALEQPTIEPERTEYIADTKALPSNRDCVDLSESVTATYYDDEHEEWSKKTVTVRDVLDSVCDDYTVIESERKKGKWIDDCSCSVCHWTHEDGNGFALLTNYNYCPNCGIDMRTEETK